MIRLSRILLLIVTAVVAFCPFLSGTVFADQSDEEKAQEKQPPRIQQAPAPSDSPAVPPKPSGEPKPKVPAGPSVKPEGAPDREGKEKEAVKDKEATKGKEATKQKETAKEKDKEKEGPKEKEPVRKTLGSLILTVKLALLADSRLFHYDVEVEEDQQTVTLEGQVSSDEEKAASSEIAQAVPGVKTVVNKLSIDKGLAQAWMKKQDELITALVKERFTKSATLKAANFEVKTDQGVVTLSGTTRFQVIALEAAQAARQVPGVKAVKTDKIRLEGEN